jgi:2',3'-cyclic-nucleotide 2'-phosphodiesterase (5'-nucleotidase family)
LIFREEEFSELFDFELEVKKKWYMLEEVLCPVDTELDGREITVRRSESNLGNLVTNAMLEATCADVALLNSGDFVV